MICPNCKTKNDKNYCIKCGYLKNGNIEMQILYNKASEFTKTKEKLRTYIGKDSYKILSNRLNGYALIFGPLYYLYRNCYKLGTLNLIVFTYITTILLKHDQRILLTFLILNSLLNYMTFNSIYIKICTKELTKTKKQEKGKSILSPFIAILLITIILYLIYK